MLEDIWGVVSLWRNRTVNCLRGEIQEHRHSKKIAGEGTGAGSVVGNVAFAFPASLLSSGGPLA